MWTVQGLKPLNKLYLQGASIPGFSLIIFS